MRTPNEEDLEAVRRAYQWMLDNSPGPQMRFSDIDTVMEYIATASQEGRAFVWEGYLLLFHIGSPWYSKKLYLIEELVIRIHKTDKTSTQAVGMLEGIARAGGCVLMAAGDTQVGHMAKIYTAEGFAPIGTQFVKEL